MKKIVYDLDGTLISFNTFKGWIIISIFAPLFSLKLKEFFKILSLVIARATKKIDRLSFKEKLLVLQNRSKFWNKIGGIYAVFLAKYCLRKHLLKEKTGENTVCLATAAPDIYANRFAEQIGGIDIVLSTYISDELKMIEVFGEKKKEDVLAKLAAVPDIFYTDHYDDAPLARISQKTYFTYPSTNSLDKIKVDPLLINYEIIS